MNSAEMGYNQEVPTWELDFCDASPTSRAVVASRKLPICHGRMPNWWRCCKDATSPRGPQQCDIVILRKKGLLHSCPLVLKQGEQTEPMLLQTGLLGPLTTQCDLLCWSGLCKTTVGWEGGLNQRLQSCDTWAWCPFTNHQPLLTEAYRQKLCQFNRSLIGHFVRLVDAAWLRTGCATEKTKRVQCTSKNEPCGTSKKWDEASAA